MLDRTRQALVESYVGAIALGYLFAESLLHVAGIISAPVSGWIMRSEYRGLIGAGPGFRGSPLQDALPELVKSVALLLLWYILLRWLYFKPLEADAPTSQAEGTATS